MQEWHTGVAPDYGLAVHGPEVAPERYRVFFTKESSQGDAAHLVIEWHMPGPTPDPSVRSLYLPIILRD